MTLDSALPRTADFLSHHFPTMTLNDLIGPDGELLLCKLQEIEIIEPDDLEKRSKKQGASTNFTDPNFVEPVALGGGMGRGGGRGRGRGGGRGPGL